MQYIRSRVIRFLTILAIFAKGPSNGGAETLEIIPAVVVRFQSSAGKFHQIEHAVDLKKWTRLDTIAGDGRIASRTVEVRPNSNRYLRMRDEGHSMLSSLSVSGPAQALAPAFSPDTYRYSVTTNSGPIRIRAGVGEGRQRIGGRDLPAGGEITAEPGSDAGRITRYEIVPVPTHFRSISIINNRTVKCVSPKVDPHC